MQIKEIQVKSCLNKSKLTDYVINPYTGCSHACTYCYADFIRRFQNIKEKWGEFVYVKINCVEILKKELEKAKPGHIWMSSVCDCYMPIEEKYKLTRMILETILKYGGNKFTIEISTKSALVKRDFDLLKQLDAELGMSINSLNDETSRKLEPNASSPSERVKTLKDVKDKGIRVFAFISPVIPGITNLEEVFRELSFCDYAWVEILNIKSYIIERLKPVIKKAFPEKYREFESGINNYEEFCDKVRKEARELEKRFGLRVEEVVVH